MKKTVLALTLAVASSATFAGTSLSSEQDKLSYSIGSDLGKNFKQQDINVNPTVFMQGMSDALSGKKGQMSEEEIKKTLQDFQKQMLMKRVAQYKKQAEVNKKTGEDFLAQNKSKKGVVTTESGLQYRVIKSGTGDSPKADDTVEVEYTGKLLSGKVFDSTKKSGKPVKFKVDGVIKGWTEALQLMKPGAEWEVFIPSDLAYGPRNTGGPIGPNETLIFNIKLLSVEKKQADKGQSS